jgi:hypothetical protein
VNTLPSAALGAGCVLASPFFVAALFELLGGTEVPFFEPLLRRRAPFSSLPAAPRPLFAGAATALGSRAMGTPKRSTRPTASGARATTRRTTRSETTADTAPKGRHTPAKGSAAKATRPPTSGDGAKQTGARVARSGAKRTSARAAGGGAKRTSARAAGGGAKRTSARAANSEAKRTPSDSAQRSGARGLDLAPYTAHLGKSAGAERPSLPVRVMLLEAERLRKAAEAYAAQLKKLPGFGAEYLRDLPALIEHLAEAETSWGRARFAKTQSSRGALRKEAEGLRSAVMNAGRYLLRRDAEAQAELARIDEGEGLADLVQDLDDLADFVEAHASVFALDRRLPKKAPERARQLAAELREVDLDDGGSMRVRNLAASALDFVLGEVRAAARYLFADEPRILAPFLSRYEALRASRSRARRKAKGQGKAPAPTPEEA